MENYTEIVEGAARIQIQGKVFYNPVQEFNRDLSILVLRTFLEDTFINKETYTAKEEKPSFHLLEALAATGLRSIRYAKEVPKLERITANDISRAAVDTINVNVQANGVESIVKTENLDASYLMCAHKAKKETRFNAIDLDPYGCPAQFLDGAVQAVSDGGLLLVTATDMAILAGNCPETCYSKYGAISLRTSACHEMAVRILLKCIESHANRYSRYILPLLSISADFYIRVFVQVFTGARQCKNSICKLSRVYHCTGCGAIELQPLAITKEHKYQVNRQRIPQTCQHCSHIYQIGGPIWNAPIHNVDFVQSLLSALRNDGSNSLRTHNRLLGVLSVISEELPDTPLYVTLAQLCGTLHCQMPKMVQLKSALLNANFKVSGTHMNPNGLKTTAPMRIVWDIMRAWQQLHPIVSKKRMRTLADNQMAQSPIKHTAGVQLLTETKTKIVVEDGGFTVEGVNFEVHPEANAPSKQLGLVRYQQNPQAYWGPGTRAQHQLSDGVKKTRHQGKKRLKDNEDCER